MKRQPILKVKKAGAFTTFQDMGRYGYQRYGVPVSGGMDTFSLQIANILVGNPRNEACLEVTLLGPELEVTGSITVAITGANLHPQVNGKALPMWQSVLLKQGDILHFGKHQSGVRAYIAIAGEFDHPIMLGSKSVDVKSGFGNMIRKGESIDGYPVKNRDGIGLSKQSLPIYENAINVAVVEGPHTENFTQEAREQFFNTIYSVDANSNRMGYRLKGDNVSIATSGEIWSDAIPFGGIQIPPNGQPIILMADRQTTGGYPRIGTVISSDLAKIAQLPPQGKIQFYPVSVEEAQDRLIEMESFLFCLEKFRQSLQ